MPCLLKASCRQRRRGKKASWVSFSVNIIDTRKRRQAGAMCTPFRVVTLSSVTFLALVCSGARGISRVGMQFPPCLHVNNSMKRGRQMFAVPPARVIKLPLYYGRFDNHVPVLSDMIEVRVSCTLQ